MNAQWDLGKPDSHGQQLLGQMLIFLTGHRTGEETQGHKQRMRLKEPCPKVGSVSQWIRNVSACLQGSSHRKGPHGTSLVLPRVLHRQVSRVSLMGPVVCKVKGLAHRTTLTPVTDGPQDHPQFDNSLEGLRTHWVLLHSRSGSTREQGYRLKSVKG